MKESKKSQFTKHSFRKLVLLLLIGLSVQSMNAQTFGIRGGLNMAKLFELDVQYMYSNNYSYNPGFHAGISLDLPFGPFFSFEPALLFSTAGTKYEVDESGNVNSGKANLYYAQMSLNFRLNIKLDRRGKNKLFFSSGPYFAYGIMGKIALTSESNNQSDDNSWKVSWGSDPAENNFKPFDFGWCVGAGFEFKSVLIGASYEYGMANISAYQENGLIAQNRVWKVTLGYLFKNNSQGSYRRGGSYNRRRRR